MRDELSWTHYRNQSLYKIKHKKGLSSSIQIPSKNTPIPALKDFPFPSKKIFSFS
jgi:hypothetical protein